MRRTFENADTVTSMTHLSSTRVHLQLVIRGNGKIYTRELLMVMWYLERRNSLSSSHIFQSCARNIISGDQRMVKMIQKKKLSIAVILMSIVLISNNINIVSGSLLLQTQVMVSDALNSFFGKEIIIQPETKAEAIYAMERSNALANLKNKIGKPHKNAISAQTSLEKESDRRKTLAMLIVW